MDPSLRPLPHAVGPEKSVLSCLLQAPGECFPLARGLGITEASFYQPGHAVFFMELERLYAAGQEIELVSLVQTLLDRGRLDTVGGPAGVTDIFTYAIHPEMITSHGKILREKEVQRGMLRLFHDGVQSIYDEPEDTTGHMSRAMERLRELSSFRPGVAGTLREKAYVLCYDPAKEPPGDEVCLSLGDVPVAAMGNLTVVQGKSKVGKSAVVSAILGAALAVNPEEMGDCLGFRWETGAGGDEPGTVVHFDTEQSANDWHRLVSRSLLRAGLPQVPPRFVSLPVVSFARSERLALLRETLEYERRNGTAARLVVIDGVADLCLSPNDETEGLEIVSQLMAIAQEYSVAIILIIHENPGTETAKTRGHLGSELTRKAFANLRIDKDSATGVSVIYGTDMRKRDIPYAHGFCFGWDDLAGMHVSKGRNAAMKTEARERATSQKSRDYWEEIFEANGTDEPCPILTAKEAVDLERDIKGTSQATSEETMKKRMQRAEILGVLVKAKRGGYQLARKGQRGQLWDKEESSLAERDRDIGGPI